MLQKPTSVQEMATLIQDHLDGRQQWKERKPGAGGYHLEKRYSDRKDDGRKLDQKKEIARPTHSQQMNSNYYKSEFGEGPRQNRDRAQRRALVMCYLCKKIGHKQWDCPERKVARVGSQSSRGLFQLPGQVNLKQFCITLDTGAEHSVVKSSLIDAKYFTGSFAKVKAFNG